MSTELRPIHPARFVGHTVVRTFVYAFVASVLAFPILWSISEAVPRGLPYAIIGMIAYGLAFSQESLNNDSTVHKDNEHTRLEQLAGFVLSLIHFNGIALLTGVLGAGFAASISPSAAIGIAVIYGFWEVETASRALPLSWGGFLVFFLVVVILTNRAGRAIISYIRSSDIGKLRSAITHTSPQAAGILRNSEEMPVDALEKLFSNR